MPDLHRKTVSASEVAGLWNASNYCTRWMLYQKFVNGVDTDDPGNTRTDWGNRLENAILAAAAEELRLEVHYNEGQKYIRHPEHRIGCTRDAHAICPSRGFGIVEAKNVDWLIHRETWHDGMAPKHIELQIQLQMMVPDPEHGLPQWGCIAALVGGNDFYLYPREPNPELQAAILEEVNKFFTECEAGTEPDPFGNEREIPILNALYPAVEEAKALDLSGSSRASEYDEWLSQYEQAQQDKRQAEKTEKALKIKILAAAKDAALFQAICYGARISKSAVGAGYAALPDEWRATIFRAARYLDNDMGLDKELYAILDAPGIQTRKESIRTSIKIQSMNSAGQGANASMQDYGEAYSELFEGQ